MQTAMNAGFDVERTRWNHDFSFVFAVAASRNMEPTASEITRWEIWFETQASLVAEDYDDCGFIVPSAEYAGWSYPKKLQPEFMLDGNSREKARQHIAASQDRTRILFGNTLCEFEATNGWADRKNSAKLGAFQFIPSRFIEVAVSRRPKNPAPTASGFSQWLYSLYSSAFGSDIDMQRGKSLEPEILEARNRAFSATDNRSMRRNHPGWRLKHNGMLARNNERPPYYEIDELSVGGQALRVIPDLIYENADMSACIIVEVKHSYMTIPNNLWPNIWGQLWCYSKIPELKRLRGVTVVGEVWGDKSYHKGGRYVYLRASVRRDPRAAAFDRFFRHLFEIYRGA